jgi:hypothetical protein
MPPIISETIKDPVFQLAAVVFISALSICVWMMVSALRVKNSRSVTERETGAEPHDATVNLSQDAKFQLLLENIIAISKRLDELDAKIQAGGSPSDAGARGDIAAKLDAMYKILAGLSGTEQK